MAKRRLLPLLFLATVLVAPAYADEARPATYAGKDVAWWIGELREGRTRRVAVEALKTIGEPALVPLAKAAAGEDQALRLPSAKALLSLKLDPKPVVAELGPALAYEDANLRMAILSLLARAGPAAEPYTDAIAKHLADRNTRVVRTAAVTLGRIGFGAIDALPALLEVVVKQGSASTRRYAFDAARKIAPDSGRLMPALTALFEDVSARERRRLLKIVSKLPPETPGLHDVLVLAARDEKDIGVRATAATQIGRVLPHDSRLTPYFMALLRDGSTKVRGAAAWSIARSKLRFEEAITALLQMLKGDEATDYAPALQALAAMQADPGLVYPHLRNVLVANRDRRDVRKAVGVFVGHDPEMSLELFALPYGNIHNEVGGLIARWPDETWAALGPDQRDRLVAVLVAQEKNLNGDQSVLNRLSGVAHTSSVAREILFAMRDARAPTIRERAAQIVARLAVNEAIADNKERVYAMLRSDSANARRFAIEVLADHSSMIPIDANELRELLRHENAPVRTAAARVVIRKGGHSQPSRLRADEAEILASTAVAMLGEDHNRGCALSQLAHLRSHALPHIDAMLRVMGEDSLDSLGPAAAQSLVVIAGSEPTAREKVVPRLEEAFGGSNPVLAATAAIALATLRAHDAALLEHLPALMLHPRPTVGFRALHAARALGRDRGADLVPVMLEVARAKGRLGLWAIEILPSFVTDDARFAKVVIAGLDQTNRNQHHGTYWNALLGAGPVTFRTLAESLTTVRAETTVLLLRILASHGAKAALVEDAVRALLDHEDAKVAAQAKATLSAFRADPDQTPRRVR